MSTWLLLVLLGASPSRAEEPAATSEAREAPAVRVVVAGPEDQSAPTLALVSDLLADLDATLELDQTASIDVRQVLWPDEVQTAAAHVYVDVEHPDSATIFIVDGAYERVLVRKVEMPAGFDEAAREQIAQITRASVEALLSGAVIGLSFEQAAAELEMEAPKEPEPEPEPKPEPEPEPKPARIAVTAGYAAAVWSDAVAPLHGPALRVALHSPNPIALGGSLNLGAMLPVTASVGALDVDVAGFRARGHLGVWLTARPRMRWSVEAGGGVDVTSVRNEQTSTVRAFPFLSLRSGPAWRFLAGPHHLQLSVSAFVDLDLLDIEFVADDGALAFEPWPVRPGLMVGIGYGR